MSYINDSVFDSGLSTVTGSGRRMDICSAEPTTYAGVAAVSLGNKTGLTVPAPANGATNGRRVRVPAITDGAVTASGTATHWALTNGSSILYATGPLSAPHSVVSGTPFTLGITDVAIQDAS